MLLRKYSFSGAGKCTIEHVCIHTCSLYKWALLIKKQVSRDGSCLILISSLGGSFKDHGYLWWGSQYKSAAIISFPLCSFPSLHPFPSSVLLPQETEV